MYAPQFAQYTQLLADCENQRRAERQEDTGLKRVINQANAVKDRIKTTVRQTTPVTDRPRQLSGHGSEKSG